MNYERRISKLEKLSPTQSLSRIRLLRDETETLSDAFDQSGLSGCMADYLLICRMIIDHPKSEIKEKVL
jgi:hypothetical protein